MLELSQIQDWLSRLEGSDGGSSQQIRDRAIAQLRRLGAEQVFPLLVPRLASPRLEDRSQACAGILYTDAAKGMPYVLALLDDPEPAVRLSICDLLYVFGGDDVTEILIGILQRDRDPQVRGVAAAILGVIGTPAAIPHLIQALDSDHESDIHGHSPSGGAAAALDKMVGVEEGAESDGGIESQTHNLERLKQLAWKRYEQYCRP